jgi:ribonuclease P protein component
MTLPLRNRLKKQKDFEEVFSKGKTVKGSFFFCKIQKHSGAFLRFAVVVPAKVAPLATVRNRLKRQITRIAQPLLSGITTGYDIVLVVQKKVVSTDDEMRTSLISVFRLAHILP